MGLSTGHARRFTHRTAIGVFLSLLSLTAMAGWSYYLKISGVAPASVVAGQLYSFQPTASGRYSRTLVFSISNKPVWASFDQATGKLWGTPQTTNVGTYPNIVIAVSDGRKSAKLPAFTISVIAAPVSATTPVVDTISTTTASSTTAVTTLPAITGSALVSWLPPAQNTDGSIVTNLSGYTLSYGTTRGGPYSTSISITNPSVSSYVVQNLSPATYYFVVAARNTSGVLSAFSTEASKTIN